MIDFNMLNFVVALIALIVAIYSIAYTRSCNRRKLRITDGEIFSDSPEHYIHRFRINNLSPVPVTLIDISFFDSEGGKQI